MVKGVTRNVIVVKSPDPKLFEQALFIVRDGAAAGEGVTAEDVLEEARRVAGGYARRSSRWRQALRHWGAAAAFFLGAACASLGWYLAVFGL